MKFVMSFLAKVFANEKWEIHEAVLSALTEGGEDERTKSTWVIKIKESRKISKQIKRNLLELWRQRALSDELYKAKEKRNFEMTMIL